MKRRLVSGITGALLVVLAPSTAFAALVAEWRMDEPPEAVTMTDSATLDGANHGTSPT